MLEMIVVIFTVVGCIATWIWLNQNKTNTVIKEVYSNKSVLKAGITCTLVVVVVAAYCGWYTYACVGITLSAIDFLVKRVIFAR